MKYARIKQLTLRQVVSLVINSPTAEKALSASTDVGGMDSNTAVILVMLAVFSPVASKSSNSLVMLLLVARLVGDVLGMHSVSFLLLPLISPATMLFGFDQDRLTENETLLLRIGIKQTHTLNEHIHWQFFKISVTVS